MLALWLAASSALVAYSAPHAHLIRRIISHDTNQPIALRVRPDEWACKGDERMPLRRAVDKRSRAQLDVSSGFIAMLKARGEALPVVMMAADEDATKPANTGAEPVVELAGALGGAVGKALLYPWCMSSFGLHLHRDAIRAARLLFCDGTPLDEPRRSLGLTLLWLCPLADAALPRPSKTGATPGRTQ